MTNAEPTELAQQTCIPCSGGVPPLNAQQIAQFSEKLPGDWVVQNGHHLERFYTFADFKSALSFVVAVGDIAETQGHHPDIYLAWGKVGVTIWTHQIDALSESDFVLAAKIERLWTTSNG